MLFKKFAVDCIQTLDLWSINWATTTALCEIYVENNENKWKRVHNNKTNGLLK